MAVPRSRLEGYSPFQPTKIITRKVHEPRDERARLPKSHQRNRTSPPRGPIEKVDPAANIIHPRQNPDSVESPRSPEIVELAASGAWPQRSPSHRLPVNRAASPSTASEITYGILDYYLTSGLPSPSFPQDTPRIDTPVIDPAMEKFNFELESRMPPPPPPTKSTPFNHERRPDQIDAQAGVEKQRDNLTDTSPPPAIPRPSTERKESYSLFPNINQTTPTRQTPSQPTSQNLDPTITTPKNTLSILSPHTIPPNDSIYRSRKQSITNSIPSLRDSSSSSTGTNSTKRLGTRNLHLFHTPKTISTTSTSTVSPSQTGRWSDETVTSPGAATTAGGPRTSFGSLLGRSRSDSFQYPACFFEDDDDDEEDFGCEIMPLRRKLKWQREVGSSGRARVVGRRRGVGYRWVEMVLCGCCIEER